MPVVVQRQVPGQGTGLSRGPRAHVSLRRLQEEFPFLRFLLTLIALGNLVHYFLIPSHLAVTRHVTVCCMWNTEIRILREILRLFGAMFGSTVVHVLHQCLALLDELRTFSTTKWTRILRCSVSVLTQNGEVCSADASALSPGMRARTWKSGNYFYEVHVAGSGDDGGSVR